MGKLIGRKRQGPFWDFFFFFFEYCIMMLKIKTIPKLNKNSKLRFSKDTDKIKTIYAPLKLTETKRTLKTKIQKTK